MINRSKLESVTEEIDIGKYPENIEQNPSDQVTIGDLHGNALKFIYFLVREGVLQLKKPHYDWFVKFYLEYSPFGPLNIYNHSPEEPPPLSKNDFWMFSDFIGSDKVSINPKVFVNRDFVVRLIGDELADRGANDYFTLKIFEKLREGGVRVEILFSNHGVEFIEAMECENGIAAFKSIVGFYGQVNSLKALQVLIKDPKIKLTEEAVKKLYTDNYQPFLKAISYSIKDDCITLYTHAPVGLEVIAEIAKKLKIEYDDSSIEKLAATIDKINDEFQGYVKAGKVNELYNLNSKDALVQPGEDPFALLMWHREKNNQFDVNRPKDHNGYQINFVHGHDGVTWYEDEGGYNDHIVNLNNELGKFQDVTGGYAVVKVAGSSQLKPAPVSHNGYQPGVVHGRDGGAKGEDAVVSPNNTRLDPSSQPAPIVIIPSDAENGYASDAENGYASDDENGYAGDDEDGYASDDEDAISLIPPPIVLPAPAAVEVLGPRVLEPRAPDVSCVFFEAYRAITGKSSLSCMSPSSASIEQFKKQIILVKEQTLSDLKQKKITGFEAETIATSVKALAEKVANLDPDLKEQISNFHTTVKPHIKTSLLGKAIGALIGAALGVVAGALLGAWSGPGAAVTALAAGTQGAVIGASIGSAVLGAAGAWFSMWRERRNHPLTGLRNAAQEIDVAVKKNR